MIPEGYIGSGLYVFHPTIISTISVANPFYHDIQPYSLDSSDRDENASRIESQLRGQGDCVFLNREEVRDYSNSIIGLAKQFQESPYQITLCPLRGSRMPTVQVATMCSSVSGFRAFDFSYGAQSLNDDRIVNDLCEILDPWRDAGGTKIAVLDTAKGGYGSSKLADLLDSKVFPKLGCQHEVTFHLMHESERRPEKADEIWQHSGFSVNLHPVKSLLFEDEDRLLGYKTIREGEGSRIHPLESPGRIGVRGESSLDVYTAKSLDQAAIGIVGMEIRNVLDERADVKLVEPNYWQRTLDVR